MAGETIITVVGNLTADPELRYTQNGLAVVNFTIASTPRTFDKQANEFKDGESLFLRASAWREMAEHIAGSLTKGTRVIAQGRLTQRSYETKEGEKRTSVELEVDEIGPSLRYATAAVTRAQAAGNRGQQQGGGQAQQGWAQQAAQQGPPPGYGAPQGPPPGYPQQPPQGYPQGYPQGGQAAPAQQPQATQPPQPQADTPMWQDPALQTQDVWNTPGTSYGDETPF